LRRRERRALRQPQSNSDDHELVEELVKALMWEVKRRLQPRRALQNLKRLKTPSEKLIYLYLYYNQPQTFTGMRKTLDISKKTLAKALKKLLDESLITIDKEYLYWTVETESL